jgi:two-component system, NtrC family, response regulator AtoC
MAGTLKVFLVEDDDIFAFLVETRLSKIPGVSLSVFPMGQECLDVLHERPDVIFLDYSLPVIDGLEVLRLIKESYPEARVVMLSGLEWQQVVDQCIQAGAEDFIQKDHTVAQKVFDKLKDMFPHLDA